MQLVRPLCGKHVKNDLQLVQPPSVTILAHSSAFDSFGLLHEKQTRQLCIVDGEQICNLAVTREKRADSPTPLPCPS